MISFIVSIWAYPPQSNIWKTLCRSDFSNFSSNLALEDFKYGNEASSADSGRKLWGPSQPISLSPCAKLFFHWQSIRCQIRSWKLQRWRQMDHHCLLCGTSGSQELKTSEGGGQGFTDKDSHPCMSTTAALFSYCITGGPSRREIGLENSLKNAHWVGWSSNWLDFSIQSVSDVVIASVQTLGLSSWWPFVGEDPTSYLPPPACLWF